MLPVLGNSILDSLQNLMKTLSPLYKKEHVNLCAEYISESFSELVGPPETQSKQVIQLHVLFA